MQTLKGRTCVFAGGSGGDGVDAVKACTQTRNERPLGRPASGAK